MSISSLSSGLSGLVANSTALDSSANNIANASTNGYTPEVVSFQQGVTGGVSVNISKAGAAASANSNVDANAPSGTDLTTETVNSIQYKAGFDLNAQVVKTADQVLGTLLNIKA
ncbi:flagellar basal body rod C-terminal domain-containing protein [Undibacterium sp. Ji67W]|uniref:flagellar basal body rod C-terminal domain-containing protein n=1 Tax=Undibacterium sp. Ji67W TaxID=3413042 RepID=UPI003BF0400A